MTKRILIHVGPGKTGSSALQQWLTTHCAELRAAGVLYPPHDLDGNGVSSGNREALMDMQQVEATFRHVVSATKAAALRTELDASGCHTLLLSSEFFFPAIVDIQRAFPEAEFVVYVRNPIELLESHYNQTVKRHDETKPFVAPEQLRVGVFAHLERLLRTKVPPRLIVRPYGDALFAGGNIVSDLLTVLDLPGVQPAPQRVNASYTLDALEFKRHANHFSLGPLQPVIDRALQAYLVGEREYSLVPPETYAALRRTCVEQLDQLIAEQGLAELEPLRDELARAPQRPYRTQAATREQLFSAANALEALEPETFEHLRARVRRTPGLALPNPEFYERFASA